LVQIATPLGEIVVGTVAQLIIGAFFVHGELGAKTGWIASEIGSAVIPTIIANALFMPRHPLVPSAAAEKSTVPESMSAFPRTVQ
jgi:hypothetical protein